MVSGSPLLTAAIEEKKPTHRRASYSIDSRHCNSPLRNFVVWVGVANQWTIRHHVDGRLNCDRDGAWARPFSFYHHRAKIYALRCSVSRICSILSNCRCSGCSHPCVDSHHLCTDTAALHTAVSEVAYLVQNRPSPYITFLSPT